LDNIEAHGDAKLRPTRAVRAVQDTKVAGGRIKRNAQPNFENSGQGEPTLICINSAILLNVAKHLGVKVHYNLESINDNNSAGRLCRWRKLAEKADHLILYDQGARLNRAFIKIRSYAVREAAINLMTLFAEAEDRT